MLRNPYGGGWASAGWVHSDFLQVSVNLGLAAGLLLLSGYLNTLFGLIARLRSPRLTREQSALGVPLLLSYLVVGQMLAVQGVEFHSFTILPLWLIWAATDAWLIQAAAPPTERCRGKAAGMVAGRLGVFRFQSFGGRASAAMNAFSIQVPYDPEVGHYQPISGPLPGRGAFSWELGCAFVGRKIDVDILTWAWPNPCEWGAASPGLGSVASLISVITLIILPFPFTLPG